MERELLIKNWLSILKGYFSPDYEDVYHQTPPGGQFLLDFL
jgi:hypothetical protein